MLLSEYDRMQPGDKVDNVRAITDNDKFSANFCHIEMIVEVYGVRV